MNSKKYLTFQNFKKIVIPFSVFAVYLTLGKLGLLLATINHNSSPIWPASGFAIYALLRFGRVHRVGIFLGAFVTNLLAGSTFPISLSIALGNTSEALLGVYIYRKFNKNQQRQPGVHFKLLHLLSVSFFSSILSASVGNATLVLANLIPINSFFTSWITWLTGDMLGILIVFPAFKSFFSLKNKFLMPKFTFSKSIFFILNLCLSLFLGWIVFYQIPHYTIFFILFCYILVLLSISNRFHSYLALCVFYVMSVVANSSGHGPFQPTDKNLSLIYTQIFFACLSMSLIVIYSIKKRTLLLPAIPVLLLGWLLTGVSIEFFSSTQSKNDNKNFSYIIRSGLSGIENKRDNFQSAIRAASSFVTTNGKFNNKEWRQFILGLDLEKNLHGIHGIGFIESVKSTEFKSWYDKRNKELRGQLNVHPVNSNEPHEQESERFIITGIEPIEKNGPALGLEVSSELRRWKALNKSRDFKIDTLTDPIFLVQDKIKRAGLLYLHPLFKNDQFLGWVYAPIIVQNLFEDGLGNFDNQVGYSVYLNNNENIFRSEEQIHRGEIQTTWTFADKTFYFDWWKTQSFVSQKDWISAWAMAIGTLFTLLVAIVIANFNLTKVHAEELAEIATENLKRSEEKLIHSAKFSALGEMAAGIAHEINNPLTIIKARANQIQRLAQSSSTDIKKLSEYTAMIDGTVDRISKIIKGLSAFSRSIEFESPQQVSIKNLINETLALSQERFKNSGILLKVNIEEDFYFEGRPTELTQVLLNLLNNSFDAIKNLPEKWVEINVIQNEPSSFKIQVTDSGSGIDPEIAKKIMQPFFTTKDIGQGTGLGLSISKGIIESHQGELDYDSKCKNTRFTISLPLKAQANLQASGF